LDGHAAPALMTGRDFTPTDILLVLKFMVPGWIALCQSRHSTTTGMKERFARLPPPMAGHERIYGQRLAYTRGACRSGATGARTRTTRSHTATSVRMVAFSGRATGNPHYGTQRWTPGNSAGSTPPLLTPRRATTPPARHTRAAAGTWTPAKPTAPALPDLLSPTRWNTGRGRHLSLTSWT